MSRPHRRWPIAVLSGIMAVAGCSEQDAAKLRKVSAKTLDRAASFAEDTRERLKASIQPSTKESAPEPAKPKADEP